MKDLGCIIGYVIGATVCFAGAIFFIWGFIACCQSSPHATSSTTDGFAGIVCMVLVIGFAVGGGSFIHLINKIISRRRRNNENSM